MNFRFLLHPLPSREFCFPCGWLSNSIRPLLDSVGFTLLYRLMLRSLLDAICSTEGVMFTRCMDSTFRQPPTYLFG